MSRLSIFRDDAFLEDHVLMRAVVALGRHPENDIVLDDRTLSRFHARLERRGDRYVVVDLGGQNGVYLNGIRITGESDLSPGDRIGLGRYVAIFDEARAASRGRRGASASSDALPADPDATFVNADAGLDIDLEEADDVPGFDNFGNLDALDDLDDDLAPTGEIAGEFEGPTTTLEKKTRPRPTLVLLYNGLEASRHEVGDRPMIIGRSKTSDIVIGLLGLSRRHARIERRPEGIFVVDLGSQNGTWVNNARIDGARKLAHGDLLNFYEYGLLYLDDPNVRIGYAGAEFSATAPGNDLLDGLSSRETGRREPPPPAPGLPRATQRSPVPILDSDLEPSELSSAEVAGSMGSMGTTGNLDLGEGSFLGDEFDDAGDSGFGASLLDEHPLESALDSDLGPDLGNALDSDLGDAFEGDLGIDLDDSAPNPATEVLDAFQPIRADDFEIEGSNTARNPALDFDKTTAQARPPELGDERPSDRSSDSSSDSSSAESAAPAALWPDDAELELALGQTAADKLASVEVFLDGQLYTQVPLSHVVTRIGVDARCELALPAELGLRPWHLTLVNFGAATVAYRASAKARVKMRGQALDQAVLRDGDELRLGRVRLVFRCR